jgi:hypothetical protein
VANEQSKNCILEAADYNREAKDSKGEGTGECKAISATSRDSQLNAGSSSIESSRDVTQYESPHDSYVKRYNDDTEKRQNLVSNPTFQSQTETTVLNSSNSKDQKSTISDHGAKSGAVDQDKVHNYPMHPDGIMSKAAEDHSILEGSHKKDASPASFSVRTSVGEVDITDRSGFHGRERTQENFQADARPQHAHEWRPAKSPPYTQKYKFPWAGSRSPQATKSSHYSDYDSGQRSTKDEIEAGNRSMAGAEHDDAIVDKFGRAVDRGREESVSSEEEREHKRQRRYSRRGSASRSTSRSQSPSEQSRRNVSRSPSSERWSRRRRGRSRSWRFVT